jgi:hypothetical protein
MAVPDLLQMPALSLCLTLASIVGEFQARQAGGNTWLPAIPGPKATSYHPTGGTCLVASGWFGQHKAWVSISFERAENKFTVGDLEQSGENGENA